MGRQAVELTPMNDEDILKTFGDRVRQLRQAKGWSQEQLAARAGLQRTYVGGVERGERNISVRSLDKLARAFETALSDLLYFDARD